MASPPTLPDSVFQALVHFAPDGFLVVDLTGTIVFANAQSEPLFGYQREGLVGMRIEQLIPERLRGPHAGHRADYWGAPRARAMGSRLALTARRRDGSEFPVEISLAPVYTDDGMLVSATVRDVTEQRQLEEDRRLLLGQAAIERERDRIAADLHDGVMQTMYAVGLRLSSFLRRSGDLTEVQRNEIAETIHELDEAIGDVRRYVQDLHPLEFDGDLRTSLDDLVRLFGVASGIGATFACELDSSDLSEARAFELFLLVREALSNVRRHSGASSVAVRLAQAGEALVLEVNDDGVGFDADMVGADGHYGLRNMHTRAQAAGGRCDITSSPARGTSITVTVPLAEPAATG